LIVRRVIEQTIVCDAVPAEFAVFDHRFDALRTEFLTKQLPVEAFVGGQYRQFV
jgi:hypothetical protein